MKKYTLSLLTLSVALSSGAAFAGQVEGPVAPQTVELEFVEPSKIAHEITSVGQLEAGELDFQNYGKILANGTVTDAGANNVQVSFTGSDASWTMVHQYLGNTNSQNTIKVALMPASNNLLERGQAYELRLKRDNSDVGVFSYSIVLGENQTVNPDSYTIGVNAQRWAA